jgi:hypothetical protein
MTFELTWNLETDALTDVSPDAFPVACPVFETESTELSDDCHVTFPE